MTGQLLVRRLAACSVISALAACGGMPSLGQRTTPDGTRTTRQASWMLPNSQVRELAYVSDWATDDVFVYDYIDRKQIGELTGFSEPYGMCVDKKGDVFITNYGAGTAVEYAHGGTKVLHTFATAGDPIGCAVSPSGDLAITNFDSQGSGMGSIVLFKHASGSGKTYTSPNNCFWMWPGGYDERNDLWFLGENEVSKTNGVCELASGARAIQPVAFDQTIYSPGGTMWDGKYITLTDQSYENTDKTLVYRVTPSASGLTLVGEPISLYDTCVYGHQAEVAIPFIIGAKNTPNNRKEGLTVIGTDQFCLKYTEPNLLIWVYPTGGDPVLTIPQPPADPVAVAISIGS